MRECFNKEDSSDPRIKSFFVVLLLLEDFGERSLSEKSVRAVFILLFFLQIVRLRETRKLFSSSFSDQGKK